MVKNSKKIKQSKFVNEDLTQIRNLIIIFFIVVLICVGIYFLTDNMIKRENVNYFKEKYKIDIKFKPDKTVKKGHFIFM